MAESDKYEIVEGNYYFPPDSVNKEFFKDSKTHTKCPIKGVASYYHVIVDGVTNEDAAWYYSKPNPGYEKISNYVAFWKGIEVKD